MVKILHGDWSISLGENRVDQSSHTFGSYAVDDKITKTILLSLS